MEQRRLPIEKKLIPIFLPPDDKLDSMNPEEMGALRRFLQGMSQNPCPPACELELLSRAALIHENGTPIKGDFPTYLKIVDTIIKWKWGSETEPPKGDVERAVISGLLGDTSHPEVMDRLRELLESDQTTLRNHDLIDRAIRLRIQEEEDPTNREELTEIFRTRINKLLRDTLRKQEIPVFEIINK